MSKVRNMIGEFVIAYGRPWCIEEITVDGVGATDKFGEFRWLSLDAIQHVESGDDDDLRDAMSEGGE